MVIENKENKKRPSPGMKFHMNRDGSVVEISAYATIEDNVTINGNARIDGNVTIEDYATIESNVRVWDSARVRDYALIGGNARVEGSATIGGYASVGNNALIGDYARVGGNVFIGGNVSVGGYATIDGNASVQGYAIIEGDVTIGGNARVAGYAHLRSQTHLAWVDKVGSGHQMTLHRTYSDGEWGWQINAGCVAFNASTVRDVCRLVKDNIRGDVPEWGCVDEDTRSMWCKQVKGALKYLASMVDETITDEDVAAVQATEV